MSHVYTKGFTLLEALIYIALLSILLTSALQATYSISQNSDDTGAAREAQESGDFITQKIAWTLESTSSLARILRPLPNMYDTTLSLINADGVRIDICRNAQTIRMREGSDVSLPCSDSSYVPLTTDEVHANAVHFHYVHTSHTSYIESSTTIAGDVFSSKKYVEP